MVCSFQSRVNIQNNCDMYFSKTFPAFIDSAPTLSLPAHIFLSLDLGKKQSAKAIRAMSSTSCPAG